MLHKFFFFKLYFPKIKHYTPNSIHKDNSISKAKHSNVLAWFQISQLQSSSSSEELFKGCLVFLSLMSSKSENKCNTCNMNITDYFVFHQKIFNPPNSNFLLSELSPLVREQDPSVKLTWKLFTQWCSVPCLFIMVL